MTKILKHRNGNKYTPKRKKYIKYKYTLGTMWDTNKSTYKRLRQSSKTAELHGKR